MEKKLLPHYYKKIAFSIGLLSVFGLIFSAVYPDLLNIEIAFFNWILKTILLASMISLVLTKEKNETENLLQLRLEYILDSVGFAFAFLALDLINKLLYSGYEMKSGFEIMMIGTIYYLVKFNFRKKKAVSNNLERK